MAERQVGPGLGAVAADAEGAGVAEARGVAVADASETITAASPTARP
ncbi:hypothetical protein [Streptomyces tremellae]|uniref:Uncharacterized protein n=1 Tax=Streptomyces tremellae TaxID=1124239 RepID=A0ABP7FN43_9ACTN